MSRKERWFYSHINAVVEGGTGSSLAAQARINLGLEIGVDVQSYDDDLADIAALTPSDSNIIVGDGTDWVAESDATARTSLGLGTGDSPQFTGVNVGDASDTTITRVSAALIAVEGDNLIRASDVDDIPVDGQAAVPVSSNWAYAHQTATNAPTGFPNRTDSTLSFDTITFTITPSNGSFDYYIAGVKYTKSSAENIVIADTSGVHLIYYDGNTLSESVNPNTATLEDILVNKAWVATIYWNTTGAGVAPLLADERHGAVMSGETHLWLHNANGAAYGNGLTLSGYTEDTESDAALTFELTDGQYADEDLVHVIIDGDPATQYSQQLNGGDASIPIVYKDASGVWVEDAASTLPYKSLGAGRLAFNRDNDDTTWSQVEVDDGKWVSMTLIATNDWQYPIKAIQGQNQYTAKKTAVEEATAEIISFGGGTLSPEVITLYRFVLRTDDNYGGTKKAKIEVDGVTDFRTSTVIGGAAVATDHGALAGLADDDHAQYIKDSEFTAAEDILVGTGSGTFAKKTPAEMLAILSGEAASTFNWGNQRLTGIMGLHFLASSELTISSGEIGVSRFFHRVDTENDDASDELDTINGTTIHIVVLRPESDARTVVVKHGTGNIWLKGKVDISLDDIEDGLLLCYDTTNSKWFEVGTGGDVVGPGSSTDNAIARFHETTGKIIQDYTSNPPTISDSGDMNIDGDLDVENIVVSGNVDGVDVSAHASRHDSGGADQVHSIADDDDDTKWQMEESADEDIARLDIGGTERVSYGDAAGNITANHWLFGSSVGILTSPKQSAAKAYLGVSQVFPTELFIPFKFGAEVFDVQNELDSTVITGTATVGTAPTSLVDSGASFVGGDVGKKVWNTDTGDADEGKSTTIAAVVSGIQVTLTADIGIHNADTYAYGFCRFTAKEAGKYAVSGDGRINSLADGDQWIITIHKNGATVGGYVRVLTGGAGVCALPNGDVLNLAANDYVDMVGYVTSAAVKTAPTSVAYNYLSIAKIA